ncbi:MAG: hypothetical protein L0Y54_16370 [Sporichthyaceae bacterium]|nr:hypothetical protein [Sporichthyaceae bacterium]
MRRTLLAIALLAAVTLLAAGCPNQGDGGGRTGYDLGLPARAGVGVITVE